MTRDEKRSVIDRYLSAYNSSDIDGMLAVLHEKIEFKNISDGEIEASASGKIEFQNLAEQSKNIFSSRQQTVNSFMDDEHGATIKVHYTGILVTDLPNGMTKGQRLDLEGHSEFFFQDGLIREIKDVS